MLPVVDPHILAGVQARGVSFSDDMFGIAKENT
jgi:hypothetical protein